MKPFAPFAFLAGLVAVSVAQGNFTVSVYVRTPVKVSPMRTDVYYPPIRQRRPHTVREQVDHLG